MEFLVDNAISPYVSVKLNELGYNCLHVRDVNLQHAPDDDIFSYARKTNRVIISADTDFAYLLSIYNLSQPSLILFRKGAERNPVKQVEILKHNLNERLIQDLKSGCVIIFERDRIRIKPLPLKRE